jgi:hypothetical protein
LRFFAGCDSGDGTTGGEAEIGSGLSEGSSLFSIAKPTPLTDEYIRKSDKATAEKVEDASIPDIKIPDADEIILRFGVFYPNNYSGYWDSDETAIAKSNSKVDAIAYLLFGKGCQKQHNESKDEFDNNDDIEIRFDDVTNSDGPGYEMNINSTEGSGISIVENENKNEAPKYTNEIKRNKLLWNEWKKLNYKKFIKDPNNIWYYRIDGYYPTNGISSGDEYRNCYDQLLSSEKNYIDNYSFAYNSKYSEGITKLYNAESTESNENNVYYYSLAEIAYVLSQNEKYKEKISSVLQDDFKTDRINILNDLIGKDRKYIISKISSTGWSNAQANNASSTLNSQRNNHLATERANTAVRWFKKYANCADVTTEGPTVNSSHSLAANALNNTNADEAKLYRSATVEVYLKRDTSKDVAESETSDNNSSEFEYSEYIGYTKKELNGKTYYVNESDPSKLWQLKNGEMVWADDYLNGLNDSYGLEATVNADGVTEYPNGVDAKYGQKYSNFYRYDQEYHFFQALELTDKMTFDALTTKLRYFVPAYHSTTPEGFNARLTFLQQCTRQGNTVGSTDVDSKSANNLAFGRPPYCVLRLGDFYNQMIVIDNISINYDQTLDINIEGIGVQPLIANVSLSFTFIGGGDITGPIKRLQNAMSFNYYANASLYDNRADHVEYNWDAKASGAIDHSMKNDSSYFNDIAMQNNT